jgi:hypothetical protein
MAKFHILNGNKIGHSITLPDGPSTIGRGDQNTFAIPDDSISTQHVLLMSDAKTCRVKDRDSSNGTFVNGKQVTQADLKNGDILKIGDVEMRADVTAGAKPQQKPADKLSAQLAQAMGGKPKMAKKKIAAGPNFADLVREAGPKKKTIQITLPLVPILIWCIVGGAFIYGTYRTFVPKEKIVTAAPPPAMAPTEFVREAPPVGFVANDEPPALPYAVEPGPALGDLDPVEVHHVSNYASAQEAVAAAKPGSAVVFDNQRAETLVIDQPLTNIQFIGGACSWDVKADLVDCQFFWHTPLRFTQHAGKLERCAFYRSHSPEMRLNHSDAVSFYYGGQTIDPAGAERGPQVRLTGFIRGVTFHKPLVSPVEPDVRRWDMSWHPTFQIHSADTNAPGYNTYFISPVSVGQTAWTPFHVVRGAGISFAQASTHNNTWSDPLIEIDYGIDCALIASAFSGRGSASNAGYYRKPDKIQYATHTEWGHNHENAPFRGAAVRLAGQRNRLLGIGNLLNWSVGPRTTLPGLHYGDGILVRDPFIQEWAAESTGIRANLAPPRRVFKLDWSYRASPEVKSTSTNLTKKYPILGPNVAQPVFVPLKDPRAHPPELDGKPLEDFTGKSGQAILSALDAGRYVFLGEGNYQFSRPITNGLVFGAGMEKTVLEWPAKQDCAQRNCLGLINVTVKGGNYGYNSQSGSGGITNTANAVFLRTRFRDQQASSINVHAIQDQVYQDCEFVGARNGVTQGVMKGRKYWWSSRGRAPGLQVLRVNFVNCLFKDIRDVGIDLQMKELASGMVGIHNCVFEDLGQAIRLQGGKSHLIQNCRFTHVGSPTSGAPVVQVVGRGIVVLSHLNIQNVAAEYAPYGIFVDGITMISHSRIAGCERAIVSSRAPIIVDHTHSKDGRIEAPYSSLVFLSEFANGDVKKGAMLVMDADRFKSITLESSTEPLDTTPPPAVEQIDVTRTVEGNVVTWNPVDDPETGVMQYAIYSDGELIARTPLTTEVSERKLDPFTRPTLVRKYVDPVITNHKYEIRAINGANLQTGGGQMPLQGWQPLRPHFTDLFKKRLHVLEIEFDERRKSWHILSATRKAYDARTIMNGGTPTKLEVTEGILRETPATTEQ